MRADHDSVGLTYRASEFAKLAGVTVRALHHYDRLGLLKPSRTASGYRVYRDRDLARLEQIVALRFVGFPLKQIKALLENAPHDLQGALQAQVVVLEEKRRHVERAICAIRAAGPNPDAAALRKIIEVMEMEQEQDWMMRYYNEEARAQIENRRKTWTPDMQAEVSAQWLELIRDCGEALGDDPASDRAQALAGRWAKLVDGFTAGDPNVTEGLKKLYADQANWPSGFEQTMAPFRNPPVWEFIERALAERKRRMQAR